MKSRFPTDDPQHVTEPDGAPTEAFRAAFKNLAELREYAGYYVTAQLDSAKLSLRRVGIYAALGVLGALAGSGLIISAVVLLCWGIAGGIGAIFNIWWLGYLITGVGLLGTVALGTWFALQRMTNSSRRKTMARYQQRQNEQHKDFHHNVDERAGYEQAEK